MKLQYVFGLALTPDDAAVLQQGLRPGHGLTVCSSLHPLPREVVAELLGDVARIERFTSQAPMVERLLRQPIPRASTSALLEAEPASLSTWQWRNAALMLLTRSLIYLVDELSTSSQDVTAHLVMARAFGIPSVGLLPRELRTKLDTAQLTYTDAVVGEVEPRALTALLESLTESTSTQTTSG